MKKIFNIQSEVEGAFVDLKGERYYKISHVDQMSPFFISVVSASDHWLFISSTGSLSAGRIRPENALFPYKSVDHIHENAENTGSKSIFRITENDSLLLWEPFNTHQNNLYDIERHLYKNAIGDKIVFEEINHSLKLNYQYSWHTCEQFGFVRNVELSDFSGTERNIELIDGLQNVLPSGAPLGVLQTASALVDAYKWNEQLAGSSLALFSMYAKLSDRAEPAESLLATTVFSLDSEPHSDDKILLSSQQLSRFRNGGDIHHEGLTKGVRGSYLLHKTITLKADQTRGWAIVADIDKNHADICDLQHLLLTPIKLAKLVTKSVAHNQQELIKLMSGADAWQLTAEENTSVHHYANVLFNNMRGGVFANGYLLEKNDVVKSLFNANKLVMREHADFIDALTDNFTHAQLIELAKTTGDQQLVRLSYEYLPLTFGRRHGDPSRPWNHYEIKLKDENGDRLLSYQGNWRDIFQNWEASALSYPGFITSFIAKFVNASTVDGYNPYRITKEGVDWEKLEENDPWSNIGYWGDHQIIYLLKFLELADNFSQQDLLVLLDSDIFSYANVPYQLCGVDKLFDNPKDTVDFSHKTQQLTGQRVDLLGSDGRLVLDANNNVYMVNLTEKILVPLLAKLSNLVLDGGIWLNTQRPEWNDANNAIVGNGLSMVTLYYMRRYIAFMQKLLVKASTRFAISQEVADWMVAITVVLKDAMKLVEQKNITAEHSHQVLTDLATCAADYREKVYAKNGFSGKTKVLSSEITALLTVSLTLLDATIANNLREDGLYNAYNILSYKDNSLTVEQLYPMLEGQVAVLSAGILSPQQAVILLDKLFASEMYREDQASFMLYPDRDLTSFMNKNRLTVDQVQQNSLLMLMMEADDKRIVMQDSEGDYHFNADFENSGYLRTTLDKVMIDYPAISHAQALDVEKLYEQVFNHKAFTGRSGTMFGYEGLGSIYWHMVSKLLLAVQENYHKSRSLDATSKETKQLADFYYRVRAGIGFNKTPQNYGAFPTDPYSHTPKHSGAQQPGMTGQVKEEVITRFGELGIQISDGQLSINPSLLNPSEFLNAIGTFNYLDLLGGKQHIVIQPNQLAFTYCQVPFVYKISEQATQSIVLHFNDGLQQTLNTLEIPASISGALFSRSGKVNKIVVTIPSAMLRESN